MGEPGGLPSMGSQSRTRLKRLSSSSSKVQLLCSFIGCSTQLGGSQFPNQGPNPGPGVQVLSANHWTARGSSNYCIYYPQYSFSSTACCLGHKGCVCVRVSVWACLCVCTSCIPWSDFKFLRWQGLISDIFYVPQRFGMSYYVNHL